MMKKMLLVILLIAAPTIQTFAADGWEAKIKVSVLTAENKISFGQKTDATNGIDGLYDVPAMLSGDIRAYFLLDSGGYWRDIRPLGTAAWTIMVESELIGKTIKITWRPEELEALPAGSVLLMADTAKKALDMKKTGLYTFINDGKRQLRIVFGQ